jgi:hypothetical protein
MIDYETFLEWAKDRFGADAIKVRQTSHGIEILTHSFYAHKKGLEDCTYNLWMNPSGGKSKHPEFGSFRCWKTDTMGSLVRLVSDYDCIPFEEAETLINATSSLRELERKVHEFFGHKEEITVTEPSSPEERKGLILPEGTFHIESMSRSNFIRSKAAQYLNKRKIPLTGMHVCNFGDYKNRIIIPYFDREGELIWYNGRLIDDKKKGGLKYLKCKSDGTVTQEDVLYMTRWPEPGETIHITEGEFDAISLSLAGFVGCAIGGKYISDAQIDLIRPYLPVLAFDNDGGFRKNAGARAMIETGKKLLESGFLPKYVRPPATYKDWNNLLIERDAEILKKYIQLYEKPFTDMTASRLLADTL